MITVDDLDPWLTAIAPLIQAAQLRRIGEATWFFDLDEYTNLELKLDEPGQKLVLTTGIGTPIAGEERSTYEALLLINGLWAKTGGVRMALDSPGGAVDMIFEVPLAGLEQDALLEWIERFIASARQWRSVVTAKSNDRPGGPSPIDLDMIRI